MGEARTVLNIYFGEQRSEKLRECAALMKKQLGEGKNIICIVPDQFSFAFDKALYESLGPKDFNRVTVFSFRRLAEAFLEKYGVSGGTLILPSERMILIYLALKRVKADKELKLLSRSIDKPGFAKEAAVLFDSLRRSGLSPEDFRSASDNVGGTLGDKLSDVSLIYSAYLDILKERFSRDESSLILEGAQSAHKNSAFKDTYVYIDSFDSFSPDELMMIKAAVRDSKNVTVNLAMPKNPPLSAASPFAHCIATQNALIKIAAELNAGVGFSECGASKNINPAIGSVGSSLYGYVKTKEQPGDGVKLYRAENMYEEAELVASQIKKLVTEEGYRLSDIAVITHDMESYSQVLEAAFERYEIEAFADRTQPAAGSSLALFALDAINAAATRKPDSDKILKYIRSPFSPLDPEEISVIWDYCIRWNVDGDMWLSEFTAGDHSEPERIRKKVVSPLMKLHEASKNAAAKEISAAFCEFLKETKAAEKAFSVIEDCAEEDVKLETARLFKQLWNAVMNAVSSIYVTAGDEKMTLKAYGELLRLILSQTAISAPPQKLDSVTLADVTRSVISQPRAAFVIGLADGCFPADTKKSGLFSGRDIARLEAEGLSFDISPQAMLSAERFDCYRALTAPSERLCLSYSGQDLRGKELRPSQFIRRLIKYRGYEINSAQSVNIKDYCLTPSAAYYSYSVSRAVTPDERASLREALMSIPEYREKILRTESAQSGVHRLSPSVSRKLFAAHDINVTASRIDVYNRCPFEYFCKFGLKISPVIPIKIDPANRGTVMHYLFENVLSIFGSEFSEKTDEEIKALIAELMERFSSEELGGDFGKSAKFTADYKRLGEAASEILINMREEFKVSKFRPVSFEYDLSDQSGKSSLSIPVADGVRVNIRGIVDRVDIYADEQGKKYIRIVDYKTGTKSFSFDDIYNGINLQLLLYMLALTEGRDAKFNDCAPSGILYMKAGFLECDGEYDPLSRDQRTRLEKSAEQLRRNGLIVENDEIIAAMDETFSGKYIPVKMTSTGKYSAYSQLISEKSFKLLEKYAENKVIRFGEDLLSGRIDTLPLGTDSEHLRCAYCDYGSVCDRKKYIMKLLKKSDGEALKEMIMTESKEK